VSLARPAICVGAPQFRTCARFHRLRALLCHSPCYQPGFAARRGFLSWIPAGVWISGSARRSGDDGDSIGCMRLTAAARHAVFAAAWTADEDERPNNLRRRLDRQAFSSACNPVPVRCDLFPPMPPRLPGLAACWFMAGNLALRSRQPELDRLQIATAFEQRVLHGIFRRQMRAGSPPFPNELAPLLQSAGSADINGGCEARFLSSGTAMNIAVASQHRYTHRKWCSKCGQSPAKVRGSIALDQHPIGSQTRYTALMPSSTAVLYN